MAAEHAFDLDELEPRAKALPLIQDCEATAVSALLWDLDEVANVSIACVVSHVGPVIVHVAFSEGWRYLVRAMDRDPDDSDVQEMIEEAAREAFGRRR